MVYVTISAEDLSYPPNVMSTASYSFACVNGWEITDSLNVARAFQTITQLNDGRILTVGGHNGNNLASCETYDPQTGEWTATDSLNQYRYLHTATKLNDGRILVVGGTYYTNTRYNVTSCEIFNPETNEWTETGSLNQARFFHSAVLLDNGRVMVTGGRYYSNGNVNLSSCEIYNPGTGLWAATLPMNAARSSHAATLLADGRVIASGGSGSSTLTSTEIFCYGSLADTTPPQVTNRVTSQVGNIDYYVNHLIVIKIGGRINYDIVAAGTIRVGLTDEAVLELPVSNGRCSFDYDH